MATLPDHIPDNHPMHLLIPFAISNSGGCASILRSLKLPHLEKLLARLTPGPIDSGDEFSLSPPHERALARVLGLPLEDGLIPWAARQAQADGDGWGFITPCHWQVGSRHIVMSSLALPDFPAPESQALLAAMQPYLAEDGIMLQFDGPHRWLASGAALANLASASLDRVAGRDVTSWMPRGAGAARLQRLQSEMQMLLYTHPVNEVRAARGVPPVNSFWLSGTGALPDHFKSADLRPAPLVVSTLRDAAVNEDWTAWAQAWHALDSSECAALLAALDRGEAGTLTLCGERHAQTFSAEPRTYWKRFMTMFDTPSAFNRLEHL